MCVVLRYGGLHPLLLYGQFGAWLKITVAVAVDSKNSLHVVRNTDCGHRSLLQRESFVCCKKISKKFQNIVKC